MQDKVTVRTIFRQIIRNMNPSCNERLTLFDIVAKGDINKEKKLVLLFLRIIHIPCIATIPAAVITLAIISISEDYIPQTGVGTVTIAIMFYLFSFITLALGYKWSSISPKYIKYVNKLYLIDAYLPLEYHNYVMVFTSHLFRISLCFLTTVLWGFSLGMASGNWYLASPLFALATTELILTYPTGKRLEQWLKNQEPPVDKLETTV